MRSINSPHMIGITGPTGFLGKHLISYINDKGLPVRGLPRTTSAQPSLDIEWVPIGQHDGKPIDPSCLTDCQVIIHCAARAHIVNETADDPLQVFRRSNRDTSVALMKAACKAGVQRFIFISSIGVCGVLSENTSFSADQLPAPEEAYQIAKYEAEQELIQLAEQHRIELQILRPPLIHGFGAKGNLQRLLSALANGKRLPVGSVTGNRRSLLHVNNASSAIAHVATAQWPTAASLHGTRASDPNGLWRIDHLADSGVITTRRLVEILAEGLQQTPRLLSIPRWAACAVAFPLGKASAVRRLFGSLEVDDTAFRSDWGWKPTIGLEQGLRDMAIAWRTTGAWEG